jgi:hypothetical protein
VPARGGERVVIGADDLHDQAEVACGRRLERPAHGTRQSAAQGIEVRALINAAQGPAPAVHSVDSVRAMLESAVIAEYGVRQSGRPSTLKDL